MMNHETHTVPLFDSRDTETPIRNPPVVHIARGFDQHLPFLRSSKRPLIVISDWQYETNTQVYFWEQAMHIIRDELKEEELGQAIVLVAGDMASADNRLRGPASDAAPDFSWLRGAFPDGDIYVIYGNHDDMSQEHIDAVNPSGLPCLLPQGSAVRVPLLRSEIDNTPTPAYKATPSAVRVNPEAQETVRPPAESPKAVPPPGLSKQERAAFYANQKFEKRPKPSKLATRNKQWRDQNPQQAELVDQMKTLPSRFGSGMHKGDNTLAIGAVHGIPSSHNQGMKKIERSEYFQCLEAVCTVPIDILITHSNPKFQGQTGPPIKGDDAPRISQMFQSSSACLHVHGHMHTEPAIFVSETGKVVVNSDCRVVVFFPE